VNQSVENLAALWSSIESLCADLTEAEWQRPTGCPGWSVKDQLSHLIDYESRAVGRAGPEHDPGERDYVKNPLGQGNEVGVDYRRRFSGAEVLDEFRAVTAERLAQLRALTPEDLARETATPAGPGTVADMLTLRVMDNFSHEQDIRRALGRPGGEKGPAVDEAIGYFCRFLPLVVAKRAGAPDGSVVVFEIGDQPPFTAKVEGGRGAAVDGPAPASPTVVLRMGAGDFAALVGGRADVAADAVEVTGDADLGRRIIASLGFMP
jgi:uncharacterized protein (TIGR03083 family)